MTGTTLRTAGIDLGAADGVIDSVTQTATEKRDTIRVTRRERRGALHRSARAAARPRRRARRRAADRHARRRRPGHGRPARLPAADAERLLTGRPERHPQAAPLLLARAAQEQCAQPVPERTPGAGSSSRTRRSRRRSSCGRGSCAASPDRCARRSALSPEPVSTVDVVARRCPAPRRSTSPEVGRGLDVARRDPEVEVHVAGRGLGDHALGRDVAGADVARLRLAAPTSPLPPRRFTSPEAVRRSALPVTPSGAHVARVGLEHQRAADAAGGDVAGGGVDVDRGARRARAARSRASHGPKLNAGQLPLIITFVPSLIARTRGRVQRALGARLDDARRRPGTGRIVMSPGAGVDGQLLHRAGDRPGARCARPRRSSSPRPARPRSAVNSRPSEAADRAARRRACARAVIAARSRARGSAARPARGGAPGRRAAARA